MSLPPLFGIGIIIFASLLIIRFFLAFSIGENMDIGRIMGYIYTCFGTTMAATSAIVAGHFAVTGSPYPGQSV